MEAAERLKASKAARELFGDAFVDHYAATREWEEREFRKRHHRLGARPLFRDHLTARATRGPGFREQPMAEITCVSPIDGRVSRRGARPRGRRDRDGASTSRATAQRRWAAVPLAERIAVVMRGVDASAAMKRSRLAEIALQMGRPIRYGRTSCAASRSARATWSQIAPAALAAARVRGEARGSGACRARAARRRLRHRALELSLSDGGQLGRAGADRGQRRAPEACGADARSSASASSRRSTRRACRRACSRISC